MPLLPTVVDFDITSYTSLPGWGSLGGDPYERVSHCSSGGTDGSGVNGSRGTWRRNIKRVGPLLLPELLPKLVPKLLLELLAELLLELPLDPAIFAAVCTASTPSTSTFKD